MMTWPCLHITEKKKETNAWPHLLEIIDDGAVVDVEPVGVNPQLAQGYSQRFCIRLQEFDQVVSSDEGVPRGEEENGKVPCDPTV